jgi:hypothetical protein
MSKETVDKTIQKTVLFRVWLSLQAAAQPTSTPLKPVTVCEILMNQESYNGKNVAVIGRYDYTNEGDWLSEDTYDWKPGNEVVWPNIIWVHCCYQPAPNPPSGSLMLDEAALIEKLAQIRKSTKLQVQRRKQYKMNDGKSVPAGMSDVKETWAVAFGRIDARRQSATFVGVLGVQVRHAGYGHVGLAPVQIVVKEANVIIRDEEYPTSALRKEITVTISRNEPVE